MFVTKLTGLRASKTTFQSVHVDWNASPEPFILGYRIRFQDNSFVVPWNKTYAYLQGLHSNTTYNISVIPLHGLSDEENFADNAESIHIVTKPESGK